MMRPCKSWDVTAVLNKMAEARAFYATDGEWHTKKVSVEGSNTE
jgi:hypothetical protein